MRKRTKRIEVYFSEKEYRHFQENVHLSGCTVSDYIRALTAGQHLKARPAEETAQLRRQLAAIGNNLNQIARVANYSHTVSREDLRKINALMEALWEILQDL